MKISTLFLFNLLVIFFFSCQNQEVSKQDVLSQMAQANSYLMKKWPDPGVNVITNKERTSNLWTRAVYFTGLMELYSIDPKNEYYNYAVKWGESHAWDLRGGFTRNADNQCAGQIYIDLYDLDKKTERIANIKTVIDSIVKTDKCDDWWWIDALYMGMPVYSKLGVLEQNNAYFNKMYDLYSFTKYSHGVDGLYNEAEGLWWRDSSFMPPHTTPNGKQCYWSRGNGWVFAALARVMTIAPDTIKGFSDYKQTFIEMAQALAQVQRNDGFWNVSLHDPDEYGGRELTGTAFFTYGMAWGINNNLLPKDKYYPIVIKAWKAMTNKALNKDGSLAYVQGTGDGPSAGQPVTATSKPDFEDYGLGAFLLAGAEVYKLAK